MRRIFSYLIGTLSTYLLAVTAATQHVLNQLAAMRMPVDLGQRIASTGQNLLGMTLSFLPIIATGLLIGWLLAGRLAKRWPTARTPLFVVAGFAALIVVHLALVAVFGLYPIPATRQLPGLIVQGLCGALGGYLFARFSRPQH